MKLSSIVVSSLALVAALPVLGTAASATSVNPATPVKPVTLYYGTYSDGGVYAGADLLGQPGAGAWVHNGQVCVGVSLQVPQCVPVAVSTR